MIAGYRSSALSAVAVLFAIASFTAGCGTAHRPVLRSSVSEEPLSTRSVARLVLDEALGRVPFDEIAKQTVSIQCVGDSSSAALAQESAAVILSGAGSLIGENDDLLPRLTVMVETLGIVITERTSLLGRKSVNRRAEAVLTVDIETSRGLKRTYRVSGTYHDRPGSGYTDSMRDFQPPYVTVDRLTSRIGTYGKPIGLAVFMTVLVWTLYSYRG